MDPHAAEVRWNHLRWNFTSLRCLIEWRQFIRPFRVMRCISLLMVGLGLLQDPGMTVAKAAATNDYFTIQVVDEQTGRGVPLVELSTDNKADWWTDSGGMVAFNEPGLMDIDVLFYVRSPGYEYPLDMFGQPTITLQPTAGKSATIKLKRLNIAERLYRITGQGIYRDSLLVGRTDAAPETRPEWPGDGTGHGHRHSLSRKDLLVLGRHGRRRASDRHLQRLGRDLGIARTWRS